MLFDLQCFFSVENEGTHALWPAHLVWDATGSLFIVERLGPESRLYDLWNVKVDSWVLRPWVCAWRDCPEIYWDYRMSDRRNIVIAMASLEQSWALKACVVVFKFHWTIKRPILWACLSKRCDVLRYNIWKAGIHFTWWPILVVWTWCVEVCLRSIP